MRTIQVSHCKYTGATVLKPILNGNPVLDVGGVATYPKNTLSMVRDTLANLLEKQGIIHEPWLPLLETCGVTFNA